MMNLKAPFITFEGGEGSGKSTQAEILYRRLLEGDINVVSYREPGGTKGAEHIRELLLNGEVERWTPTTEALLMSAARADLVQRRILPQLEGGTWVVCDRFIDSTIAYQGYGHGVGYKHIEMLNQFTVGALEPDLTFIFQMDPELGLARTALRGNKQDRYERLNQGFHQRVATGYEEILKRYPTRCVAINALLDIDMISEVIFKEVSRRFGLDWLK
ncbi:MAG: dTMP kinase [Alphaproteobacteria bacterium]|nr:dTMP kinase [Alphaproteobacteria bacterium]